MKTIEKKMEKCYKEIEYLYQENKKLKELLKDYKSAIKHKNDIIDCAIEELKVLRKKK
tara:strand:+ start:283 stop:456 length:174 start_codon:yes stop_codon:yes gene_type:complete